MGERQKMKEDNGEKGAREKRQSRGRKKTNGVGVVLGKKNGKKRERI
jgi:hypothetical protein